MGHASSFAKSPSEVLSWKLTSMKNTIRTVTRTFPLKLRTILEVPGQTHNRVAVYGVLFKVQIQQLFLLVAQIHLFDEATQNLFFYCDGNEFKRFASDFLQRAFQTIKCVCLSPTGGTLLSLLCTFTFVSTL